MRKSVLGMAGAESGVPDPESGGGHAEDVEKGDGDARWDGDRISGERTMTAQQAVNRPYISGDDVRYGKAASVCWRSRTGVIGYLCLKKASKHKIMNSTWTASDGRNPELSAGMLLLCGGSSGDATGGEASGQGAGMADRGAEDCRRGPLGPVFLCTAR